LGNELALSIAQSGLFFILGKGDGKKRTRVESFKKLIHIE
jgi:hypothetical protein